METQRNKEIVIGLVAKLAKGDSLPFVYVMHDDFVFRPIAASRSGKWAD